MSRARSAPDRFDAAYYRRFYRDPHTRVADGDDVARLVAFIAAYLRYLDLPVGEIVDLGCGLGAWRQPLRRQFPRARYTGVEISEHLCRRLGWVSGSAVDYRHPRRADLVVCQGVLQYLDAGATRAAVANLARLAGGGALFLEALTREDWQHNCDRQRTDGDVHLRSARFYRQLLRPHFVGCGGGLFLHKDAPATLFELEKSL